MTTEPKISCKGCHVAPVCVVLRTFGPALDSMFKDMDRADAAFELDDLAQICKLYANKTVVQAVASVKVEVPA